METLGVAYADSGRRNFFFCPDPEEEDWAVPLGPSLRDN